MSQQGNTSAGVVAGTVVVGKAAAGIAVGSGPATYTGLLPQYMPCSAAVGCRGHTVAAGLLASPEPEDIAEGIPHSAGAAVAVQHRVAVAVVRRGEG